MNVDQWELEGCDRIQGQGWNPEDWVTRLLRWLSLGWNVREGRLSFIRRQKIQNPAWNSLSEVMRDICTRFWVDVFGEEVHSMHTDSNVLLWEGSHPVESLCFVESLDSSVVEDTETESWKWPSPIVVCWECYWFSYALLYKGMIDGILSLSGFQATTTFRKNPNSGDLEFIVAAVWWCVCGNKEWCATSQ